MTPSRLPAIVVAALAALASAAGAEAQDKLKVVIGQINNWENQVPTLGVQAGIFKKHGLELETLGTQGAGETLQPIISGSADIGIGVGTSGAMRVFVQGAPVRALAAGFTGTNDLFWYVRADSPIKSLKDLTESNTIAYSTSGSTSNNIVLGFVKVLGVKARPTPTGGPPATLTMVMSKQIDVGWGAPPLGVQEAQEGKIRIIARGSDLRRHAQPDGARRGRQRRRAEGQTRGDGPLHARLPGDPGLDVRQPRGDHALRKEGEQVRSPGRLTIKEFYPKEAIAPDRVQDIDKVMADAVR